MPFLLSAVLVLFGLVVRHGVKETPVFAELEEYGERQKRPLVAILRRQPLALIRVLGITVSGFVLGT
ncbi:hypothetical protein ACGFOW_04340 [Streptomyces rubiginosohelvolus]|uniref:hypothetical protein n=1 Tax=Streptomyces rubiginosohelvolus TaxID=67362 RepID=UPI0037227937